MPSVKITEDHRIAIEAKQTFYCNISMIFEQEDPAANFSIFQLAFPSPPLSISWKENSPADGFSLRAPPAFYRNLVQ